MKKGIIVLGIMTSSIVGALLLWRVGNETLFFIAQKRANVSPLYSQSTNGISNKQLISVARNYFLDGRPIYSRDLNLQNPNTDLPASFIATPEMELAKDGLSKNWFMIHAPGFIEYNSPKQWPKNEEYLNNKYVVDWYFSPNCEPRPWGGDRFYSHEGTWCADQGVISVIIDTKLQAERATIDWAL